MHVFLGALLIFSLRICDVSIGTLRTMYMVRGDRFKTAPLAFVEAGIWVFAISRIMTHLNDWPMFVAYAAGFATGTFIGITIERWIASGWIIARIVGSGEDQALVGRIRESGFGLTVLQGEGRDRRPQCVLFVVTLRRRSDELIELIAREDPGAFVTVDSVQPAMGGYLHHHPAGSALRK